MQVPNTSEDSFLARLLTEFDELLDIGDDQKALDIFTFVSRPFNDGSPWRDLLCLDYTEDVFVSFLDQEGTSLLSSGEYKKALDMFRFLTVHFNRGRAWSGQVKAEWALGMYSEARRHLEELDPDAVGWVTEYIIQRQPSSKDVGGSNRITSHKWDVFISHAAEDKELFARPLANALQDAGISVWFDEFTLRVGDSLRRAIEKGLAQSRYGIVIISEAFLRKEWPQKELDGLTAREVNGQKVILPIWHNISVDTLRSYAPSLTDRVATSSHKGIDNVVKDLLDAIER